MLQDGVGESQDRKEYKRQELQEERKREREVEETWCNMWREKRVKKKKECSGHQVQEGGRRSKIV
jgi:hypothetical protein